MEAGVHFRSTDNTRTPWIGVQHTECINYIRTVALSPLPPDVVINEKAAKPFKVIDMTKVTSRIWLQDYSISTSKRCWNGVQASQIISLLSVGSEQNTGSMPTSNVTFTGFCAAKLQSLNEMNRSYHRTSKCGRFTNVYSSGRNQILHM